MYLSPFILPILSLWLGMVNKLTEFEINVTYAAKIAQEIMRIEWMLIKFDNCNLHIM